MLISLPSSGFFGTLTPTLSPHVNRGWRSRSHSESSIMTSCGPSSSRPASQSSWEAEVERLRASHDVFTSGQPMLWTTYAPSAPHGTDAHDGIGAIISGSGQPPPRPSRGNTNARRHTMSDLGPRKHVSGTTAYPLTETSSPPQNCSSGDICVTTHHDLSINNAGQTRPAPKFASPTS